VFNMQEWLVEYLDGAVPLDWFEASATQAHNHQKKAQVRRKGCSVTVGECQKRLSATTMGNANF
jgi:hypothetical protein